MISRVSLIVALALTSQATPCWPQGAAADRVISLQDGGRIVVRADGVMRHYDARGNPVSMRNGEVMLGADGSRIMMRGDALWQEVLKEAASLYAHSLMSPGTHGSANERKIELADGGVLVIRNDGSVMHQGRDGVAIQMDDGTVMVAKDGSRILMKNGSLWSAPSSREGTKP